MLDTMLECKAGQKDISKRIVFIDYTSVSRIQYFSTHNHGDSYHGYILKF